MASYRKLSSGWEYRIIYRDTSGKRKETSKRGFRTKSEATKAARLAELNLNITEEKLRESTVIDYVKSWANIYKRPHISAKTWQSYTQNFPRIEAKFGNKKIKDITPTYYQKVLNELAKEYAQQTMDKFHYQIKGAMKSAVRDGIINTNFADGAIVKSQKQSKKEVDKFLEESEYLNFIKVACENMKHPSYFIAYLIAVTGMRYAEASGLTPDDFDFTNNYINVNKTYDYSVSQRFGPTKNEQSIRQIPVSQQVMDHVRFYLDNYYKPNDLNRVCHGTSNTASNKAIKRVTGRNVTNHSLRHTYASYLIYKGVDLISVSKLLGHENLNITLKVYAHQIDSLKAKNDNRTKEIFSKIDFGG
ncbi:tyrosine-type recombinase/integrase [Streptococcus thoraltensis]|uniref:site-specific integrase n=1 Tax=Streptococcus thoraltensis TaxID=55085 RepID=UPI001F56D327|nr:tyrosine-type recombinase/integrase [Streptococcus thoraltensis]